MSNWTLSQRNDNGTTVEFLIEPGSEGGVAIVASSTKRDEEEKCAIFTLPVAEAYALADVIRSIARIVEETNEPK